MYIYMYIYRYTYTYVDGLHSCAWHDSSTRVSWLIHVRGWRVTDIVSIWMSRSTSFPDRSFEWRGHREFPRKLVWNLGDSREKLFNMYGDSRENLLEILAVVIISSAISSVCSMNESRHIEIGHVTHLNKACHAGIRHGTHIDGTCHTYDWVMLWVMSKKWMIHVTHMDGSCHTYEWVSTHRNESCRTYDWGMSSRNTSWHIYGWVMSHIWMSTDT